MSKIICGFKFLAFRIIMFLKFYDKIQIGFTGNLQGFPKFNIKNGGRIQIFPHCRISKSHLGAIDGGIIQIGEGSSIGENDIIVAHGRIVIGKNCSMGPNVCIYDHDHCFDKNGKGKGFNVGDIKIGNNVWLGAGVIVLRNTYIGENCVIGAGTVVKGNIPDNSMVVGNRQLMITELK